MQRHTSTSVGVYSPTSMNRLLESVPVDSPRYGFLVLRERERERERGGRSERIERVHVCLRLYGAADWGVLKMLLLLLRSHCFEYSRQAAWFLDQQCKSLLTRSVCLFSILGMQRSLQNAMVHPVKPQRTKGLHNSAGSQAPRLNKVSLR